MNNGSLQNFEFEGNGVRSFLQDDEPWFVLSDVCRVLEIANARNAAARLDYDEKMTVRNMDSHSGKRGGAQFLTIINESGLYSVVLTSRKDAAKRFKKWITSEVLPALRRTGMYIMDGRDEVLPSIVDRKVFGMHVAKVNAAARLISVANAIYGPEAARALWESEPSLPKVAHKTIYSVALGAEDNPEGCLIHILQAKCSEDKRVADILQLALHDGTAARLLPQYGLMLDPPEHKGRLAVASTHPFLDGVFANSGWSGGWQYTLMQLDSTKPSRLKFTEGGALTPVVLIPRRIVQKMLTAYQ